MNEHQHTNTPKPQAAPVAKPHTPATTSETKPKVQPKAEPMNFNEPAAGTSRPAEVEAAPESPATATEAPKRRGRPPRDPNAAPSPSAPAAPPKPVAEMGLGELMREHEKAIGTVTKAHEMLGAALPRSLEIAAAIKSKLA